jgi:hypothetical protein
MAAQDVLGALPSMVPCCSKKRVVYMYMVCCKQKEVPSWSAAAQQDAPTCM